MSSKSYYPTNVTQTTGGKYKTFDNKDNIKTASGYAECHVGGKSASLNRPSTIFVNKFSANIPNGAMITKVTVKYKHSKAPYNGHDCNVQAPTISLMNGDAILHTGSGTNLSKKGQAPTPTATERSVVFQNNLAVSIVNSNNFKVKVDYPTNANNYEGYVRLYYVKVIIEYTESTYGLNIQHLKGEYNGDQYILSVGISNLHNTNYNPTVTLTNETGFSLNSYNSGLDTDTDFTFTRVDAQTIRIVPSFSRGGTYCQVILVFDSNFTYATGVTYKDCTFSISESLHSSTVITKTVRVTKDRPVDPSVDPDTPTDDEIGSTTDEDNVIPVHKTIPKSDVLSYSLEIGSGSTLPMLYIESTTNNSFKYYNYSNGSYSTITLDQGKTFLSLTSSVLGDNNIVNLKFDNVDVYDIKFVDNVVDGEIGTIYDAYKIFVCPQHMSTPFLALLSLTTEELHRLGDGYNYTVQSYLKEVTSESYVRDWYKNFRIGVFNNPIWSNITYTETTDPDTGETIQVPTDSTDYTNLTTTQIFNNAEYWSNQVQSVNAFESLNCTFTYTEDYPLYIILVGDYEEATTVASVKYTEPVIVESEVFSDWETNGTYPIPIDDLVLSDGSSSELVIGALNNASPLVFYDFPLEDDYGTNDEIAIRGLEIRGTIESNTDNLILHASLKNGKQETRQRSLTLDELQTTLTDENQFSIGGIGDLWGFSTLDIINLEDWEAHLTISNILNESQGGINFRDIQLVIYIENIEPQLVKTYINGQDVSYYGAFLTDLKIPEGLKTDTAYLDINGTDVNDPYRQNIKEKTIEVSFDIGDCDLEGSTLSLREFTRLLVNERDKYNKPIPKRIEFSHYPDVYWEYILEDTLENDLEISTYNVKAKLVVPHGTSYDKKTTKSNDVGYVSGLAHIRPVIQLKPSSTLISIREDISEQEFNMSYTSDWLGKVIEIDCDNRKVYLKEDDDDVNGEDISNYVDFNSDWFTIMGEYQFQTVGCAIMSVQYQERW